MKHYLIFFSTLLLFISCDKLLLERDNPDDLNNKKDLVNLDDYKQTNIKDGAILSEFSVSKDKKIYFSQGNLQYCIETKKWRFAERQFESIFNETKKLFYYDKDGTWQDVFGYGNSGYNKRLPYDDGISFYHVDENISNTNYDWGVYNPIINGGKKANLWRTLTKEEWYYLFVQRLDAHKKWSLATISGKIHNNGKSLKMIIPGLILLPDNFDDSIDISFDNNEDKEYSFSEWIEIEKKGAVFLPESNLCYDANDRNADIAYWTSSFDIIYREGPYYMYYDKFLSEGLHIKPVGYYFTNQACAVRLVQDVK